MPIHFSFCIKMQSDGVKVSRYRGRLLQLVEETTRAIGYDRAVEHVLQSLQAPLAKLGAPLARLFWTRYPQDCESLSYYKIIRAPRYPHP